MAKRGTFICIEGIDGSGKTTQARRLVSNLRRRGFDAVYTTEPSTGKVGRLIRRYVLDRKGRVPIALEALLFAADRVDHLEKEIKPALKNGKVVACDRYVYSTLAYQGAAGLDLKWIELINRFALIPDLALFLDVPPEMVVKRLKQKRSVMETLPNQQRVREVYMQMVREGRLNLVDGTKSKEKVSEQILTIVSSFLERRGLSLKNDG
jgi:dTMP kinase